MSTLVSELKTEHAQLLKLMQRAQDLGPVPEAFQLLDSGKKLMLAHFQKEDTYLYPKLEAATGYPEIQSALNLFRSDMAAISKNVAEFFSKHQNGKTSPGFATDFGRLMGSLKTRLRREEERLYPLFDKVTTKVPA